ncbi:MULTISPECIES: CHASE2 domain-containing serine/threonine-protein kinase [unclassified Tolypothrix]|uniref:CHASE2 domain-containing serine/threonine-protein kinase n=1 Tax=unclassified Tolypothrix TaxID=2649714 RepID=UPI0005EABA80|nr:MULTISPECIES: CHASE2 domain-containing serine/threonine-protein kinase [unclassified Tolypothrix]BAY92166.1 serine/threonine protein kinase with Chase2 sensor [Microchaete diplosiphon NIES-3275]EKE98533.1 serine/threonine protein kinase [Tolypothrix sp. PCC 7601]MBE9087729.1 CHASE2 domain-containing protein [Tolypothrix sp. LEGE 11397]UYD30209.1 CHASE2 domain-containing protein [Tolypothrix sp. PCC 7712]UYD31620.1 CHASE2 domain-containing protein [Tolypothrix sp. PCC 7601]
MFADLKTLFIQPAIITSACITVLMLGIQKLGVIEPLELKVYDRMMQMRADPGVDSRLLIVAVTEQDLKKWNWPLSGEVLDRALGKLEAYEPRAIGLDIFRDLPVQPGHEKLLKRLQDSDIITPVCKHSEKANPGNSGTAPPQGIEADRVGFSDVVEDTDGVIRRNLISVGTNANEPCQAVFSFSFQLALKYLAVGGIQPQLTSNKQLQLRNIILKPLQPDDGAYQHADTTGYQILLNYRSPRQIAQQVTITELLSDQVKPELVKDRIVLIGSTASSLNDFFNTPYGTGKSDRSGKIPGIELHAHSISQILSVVLNKQPLFWFLPEWGEVFWIWGWALVGGLIAWRIQHPLGLGIAEATSILVLCSSSFVIFTQAGWFPVVSPVLGLLLASGGVLAYTAYQSKQEQAVMMQKVQDQKELIAQLQNFVSRSNEATTVAAITHTFSPITQELQTDTILNKRYRITSNLGSGGFSYTYLAEDTQRPGYPQCVVKQLRPASQDTEYLDILRRLFKTEAKILEIVGNHPQIPSLLAFFEENKQFYLIQEYISGHPLSEEINSDKRLKPTEVTAILKDVLQVLIFIHSYGVIHRDLKPSNLIRRKADGRVVVIDFGAVKQVQPQEQDNQTIAIGTPGYAATEQLSGQPTLNSDIFALGMIAIQALTGVYPKVFRRDINTGAVILPVKSDTDDQTWQYWWELAETTETFARVLDRMVHLDFTQRYQSASEVLNTLENF